MASAKKKPGRPAAVTKKCVICGVEKTLSQFFVSPSPVHPDGRCPMCKGCFVKMSIDQATGEIVEDKFKDTLQKCDRPYYIDKLDVAVQEYAKAHPKTRADYIQKHGPEIIGIYMRRLGVMRGTGYKTYQDSEKENFIYNPDYRLQNIQTPLSRQQDLEQMFVDDLDFEVTDAMIRLFGEGYSRTDYRKMYTKYETLKSTYSLQTTLHQEALATYVRFKVKEEEATARGDVDEAKKWYDAANNAATSGKLTPKQMTAADLHGGINNFSEIFKAVEEAVDVIPILPEFKFRPLDAPDFIIWCYINYARDLEGMPQVSYEDVYKFYDKKKAEYVKQYGDPYGIFTDDPTENEKLRESVEQFIQLPDNYDSIGDDN